MAWRRQSVIADAADGKAKPGTVYELGGPDVRTFRQLMEYVLKVTERKRFLAPLPFGLGKFIATCGQFMPTPMITPDQVEWHRRWACKGLHIVSTVNEALIAIGAHCVDPY